MTHNFTDVIAEALAWPVVMADNLLYKAFGLVSPMRRELWRRRGERLQDALDAQHEDRDRVNRRYGLNYTTKRALEFLGKGE